MSTPKLISVIILKLIMGVIATPFFIIGFTLEVTMLGFHAGIEAVERISNVR